MWQSGRGKQDIPSRCRPALPQPVDHLDKKFFSSTAYPPNNTNLKIRRRAGRLSTKISNPAVCRLLILVNSHPALYFLLEFRACWEKMFWHEGKFSDLKSLISALAVA